MVVRTFWNQPVNNAVVEVLIGGQAQGYVGICPNQTLVDNTNEEGEVCFNLAGGGCLKHYQDAVVIRANGVVIREYDAIMSADYTGWDDNGIPDRWDHLVSPPDLAAFVTAYQGGVGPASCHDYDNNEGTGPTDLAVFMEAYKGGTNHCP